MTQHRNKSANGDGSIYQTLVRGRTVWKVSISLGFDPSGKRLRTTRTVRTQSDAKKLLRTLLAEQDSGRLRQKSQYTVRSYGTYWAREVKPNQVRQTTASGYEDVLTRYVYPTLGSMQLVNLRAQDIEQLLYRLRKRGLSASTVNQVRRVLSGMCKHAARQQIIGYNPASATDPVKRQQGERTQVQKPWTTDEAKRALATARATPAIDCLLTILLTTGLRPGEAAGLRWEDIDFGSGLLTVNGTLREERRLTADGRGVVQLVRNPPKTSSSRRTLPIPSALLPALERQKFNQIAWATDAKERWQDSGYVVTSKTGKPCSPSNLRRMVYAHMERHGLRRIRLHDIRHVVARMMLETAAPIEEVSQALGHTRIDTTKQTYAGTVQAMNDRFVGRIDALYAELPDLLGSDLTEYQLGGVGGSNPWETG